MARRIFIVLALVAAMMVLAGAAQANPRGRRNPNRGGIGSVLGNVGQALIFGGLTTASRGVRGPNFANRPSVVLPNNTFVDSPGWLPTPNSNLGNAVRFPRAERRATRQAQEMETETYVEPVQPRKNGRVYNDPDKLTGLVCPTCHGYFSGSALLGHDHMSRYFPDSVKAEYKEDVTIVIAVRCPDHGRVYTGDYVAGHPCFEGLKRR